MKWLVAGALFASVAWADIAPLDVRDCREKAAGAACKADDGKDATCVPSSCSRNEYTQIRPARKADIRQIIQLTKKSMQSEELVRRTRTDMEKQIGDYFIYEIDRNVVGCIALHAYPDVHKGELAFLYVSPSHENQGIGRKLIQFVENRARELNMTELLVLSTQSFTYFQSKVGFAEGSPDDLPAKRRERYDQSGRNSKVLVKKLK